MANGSAAGSGAGSGIGFGLGLGRGFRFRLGFGFRFGGGGARFLGCAADGERGARLGGMGDFVGDQAAALAGCRIVLVGAEEEMRAEGEGAGLHVAGKGMGGGVVVDAEPVKLASEGRFEVVAQAGVERYAAGRVRPTVSRGNPRAARAAAGRCRSAGRWFPSYGRPWRRPAVQAGRLVPCSPGNRRRRRNALSPRAPAGRPL